MPVHIPCEYHPSNILSFLGTVCMSRWGYNVYDRSPTVPKGTTVPPCESCKVELNLIALAVSGFYI